MAQGLQVTRRMIEVWVIVLFSPTSSLLFLCSNVVCEPTSQRGCHKVDTARGLAIVEVHGHLILGGIYPRDLTKWFQNPYLVAIATSLLIRLLVLGLPGYLSDSPFSLYNLFLYLCLLPQTAFLRLSLGTLLVRLGQPPSHSSFTTSRLSPLGYSIRTSNSSHCNLGHPPPAESSLPIVFVIPMTGTSIHPETQAGWSSYPHIAHSPHFHL